MPPQEPALGPGLDRSSAGLLFGFWHRRPVPSGPVEGKAPGGGGLERPSGADAWRCAGGGAWSAAVSVITFFRLTVPTVVSIGCDTLIK